MRYVAVIAGFFALLVVAQPAFARAHWRDDGFRGVREHDMRGPGMRGPEMRAGPPRLDRFLPDIRRQHPGRLLDVQPGWGSRGEPRNRIKWLTPDGRVIWLDQDARTGEFHEYRGEDRAPPPPPPYD